MNKRSDSAGMPFISYKPGERTGGAGEIPSFPKRSFKVKGTAL